MASNANNPRRKGQNKMCDDNNSAAFLIFSAVRDVLPDAQLYSLPSFTSKSKGELEFKLSGGRPSDEVLAAVSAKMKSLVQEDQTMQQLDSSMNELSLSECNTWSSPLHKRTGTMLVPTIFHTKFNANRSIWLLNFRIETTGSAPVPVQKSKTTKKTSSTVDAGSSSWQPGSRSVLQTHSEEVAAVVRRELSAFVDLESLIKALPEPQQVVLDRRLAHASQRVLERFQNLSYAAGLVSGRKC